MQVCRHIETRFLIFVIITLVNCLLYFCLFFCCIYDSFPLGILRIFWMSVICQRNIMQIFFSESVPCLLTLFMVSFVERFFGCRCT